MLVDFISRRTINIVKKGKSINDGAREIEFKLPDGDDDGEYTGFGSEEKYQIFTLQDDFFLILE